MSIVVSKRTRSAFAFSFCSFSCSFSYASIPLLLHLFRLDECGIMLGKRVYIQTDHKRLYHILPRTNKTYTCKPNLKDWNVQTHQELLYS